MSNYETMKSKLEITLSNNKFAIVERDSLYTWALWNTNFIKYVDKLNHSL